MKNRTLFFGDNLEILRDKFVGDKGYFDLIYLDPPFSSNKDYNIIFREGTIENHAQIRAFEDSWHWTPETQRTFEELIGVRQSKTKINQSVSDLMTGFEKIIGKNDVMAYLVMMTIRLIELHRVLKPTGSLYLHCDPTASHYLKILLDVVFDKKNFRNEIIWQKIRTTKSQTFGFGNVHDVILSYKKTDNAIFKTQYKEFDAKYIESHYKKDPAGRLFRTVSLLQKGQGKPRKFGDKLLTPPKGTHWIWSQERIDKAMSEGLIRFTSNGRPEKIQFLDEMKGDIVDDIWSDIYPINPQAKERLDYPTQKPEALLTRIIESSSNEGDWILDPFCGCGTTVVESEKVNRNWVGIDITMLAINLIKNRLLKQFVGKITSEDITLDGIPKDVSGAKALFQKDPFEFEYWALDLVNAMPAKSKSREKMRGADKGVDGMIVFRDIDTKQNISYKRIIVQVKGGKVQRNDIATLKGDVEREKGEGGVLITLEESTKPMEDEANMCGFFETEFPKVEFPKIQIITVNELLDGKTLNLPKSHEVPYYKKAERVKSESKGNQVRL